MHTRHALLHFVVFERVACDNGGGSDGVEGRIEAGTIVAAARCRPLGSAGRSQCEWTLRGHVVGGLAFWVSQLDLL